MRRIVALAATTMIGGALVAANPGFAAAANGIPKAAGFHVGSDGNVVPLAVDGQHVRASDGTVHVFAYSIAAGDGGGFQYATRAAGSTTWTKVPVAMPDTTPQHETPSASLEISADGTTVHAFITTCSGTYVFEAPIDSTTLGDPTMVPGSATTLCAIEGQPLIADVPTTGDNDLFLYSDGTTAEGPPAGPLTAGDTIPGVGKRRLLAISRDSSTGELAVLGEVLARGMHVPVSVWTKPTSGAWSSRTTVAHVTMPGHFIPTATITSGNGQVLVGIDSWKRNHRNGLKLVSRSAKGKWSSGVKMPHTNQKDSDITLTTDPVTGRIAATYIQVTPGREGAKHDGLLVAQHVEGRWHQPTFVRHEKKAHYVITVSSVSFDSGTPSVGYVFDD
jgi:hypothetical protein